MGAGRSPDITSTRREIKKEPGTPEWYAQASRVDRTLGTRTAAMVAERLSKSKRFVYLAKVSYVTGSHNFKAGFETNFGPVINTRNKNADLDQEYRNGIPDTVRVSNTPIWTEAYAGWGQCLLRAGFVDARPPDAQRRRALGMAQYQDTDHGADRRPVRRASALRRTDGPARLVRCIAAIRSGLRPLRHGSDRAQVQHQQVHGRGDYRVRRRLQPDGARPPAAAVG